MKKTLLLITLILVCCLSFLACKPMEQSTTDSSSSAPEIVLPVEKEDCVKEFTIDAYLQESIVISPADYVDANGLTDLSYQLTISDSALATLTSEDAGYRILAVDAGNLIATLKTMQDNECVLSIEISIAIISTAPTAPVFTNTTISYDRCAGGKLEVPVEMNRGIASMLNSENGRVLDAYWAYNEETGCLEIAEEFVLDLALAEHSFTFITTGGSATFTLNVFNSITTAFDEETEKEAFLGKTDYVAFNITLNEAEIVKVTFGGIELTADEDYSVAEGELRILSSFFAKTIAGDEREYKVYLSNKDAYTFNVNVTNQLFFTDYDVTTIHDDFQSTIGHNPLYQDSTRVQLVDAPENSALEGKVLKFEPHTTDVSLDVHGVYTLECASSDSLWMNIPFNDGKYYAVSFDYMTVGTTAGETFAFRSWHNKIYKLLDTGKPGEVQHFSHVFKWEESQLGLLVFGKFVNGGCIYFDNYRIVELGSVEPTITAGDYKSQDTYTVACSLAGFPVRKVLINDDYVEFAMQDENVVINGDYIKLLPYGKYTVSVVSDLFTLSAGFNHEDPTQKAELYETAKTFVHGTESIKLSGLFDEELTVTSLYRQGANNLDWINGAWQAMTTDYVELTEDGLIIKKGLLDQVYETCTYSIYLSNGVELPLFTLTSNAVWFCNFDETLTWHSSLAEDHGVWEIVSGVEGMSGNVIKLETKNYQVYEPWTWYTRIFCFEKLGWSGSWNSWNITNDKTYQISFDIKVDMNGAIHDPAVGLGYYYTIGNNGERAYGIDYTDGKVHTVTFTISGNDLAYFAIGLDPRHGDLQSILYVDNFGIKEVVA